jgi:hypothetical protein
MARLAAELTAAGHPCSPPTTWWLLCAAGPQGRPGPGPGPLVPGPETGHAIPCGIYDVAANEGFVNVGTGANAASLVVESVRRVGGPWPAGTRTRGPRACW